MKIGIGYIIVCATKLSKVTVQLSDTALLLTTNQKWISPLNQKNHRLWKKLTSLAFLAWLVQLEEALGCFLDSPFLDTFTYSLTNALKNISTTRYRSPLNIEQTFHSCTHFQILNSNFLVWTTCQLSCSSLTVLVFERNTLLLNIPYCPQLYNKNFCFNLPMAMYPYLTRNQTPVYVLEFSHL